MTRRHRDWRAWLAVAVSAGLAGAGTLAPGQSAGSSPSAQGPGSAGGTMGVEHLVPPYRQALPPAVVLRQPAEASPAAAPGYQAGRHGHRALGADATAAQLQLPAGRDQSRACRTAPGRPRRPGTWPVPPGMARPAGIPIAGAARYGD